MNTYNSVVSAFSCQCKWRAAFRVRPEHAHAPLNVLTLRCVILVLFLKQSVRYLAGMPKPLVYVETTIASFYYESHTDPGIVARREWTQRWWDSAPEHYELVTSPAVLDELAGGIPERSAKRLALVRELPLLAVELPIAEIVQGYIRHKLMPADPGGDALHLALASYHKCDFR